MFWLFWFCIFNAVCIPNRLNQSFSTFSINCNLPLSYSLPVRLAFLSPDVSALRIRNWSGIQRTLTKIFRLKQLISKENILLKILWPGMIKIFQTGATLSEFKISLAEMISKFFRKSHIDFRLTCGVTQWPPLPSSDRSLSITVKEKERLKKRSFLINNKISLFYVP